MSFRAFRSQEFDISELSLSRYTLKVAEGTCPYVAIPVFLSRAFRHSSIYVRKDRIKRAEDLKGARRHCRNQPTANCVFR
jgi:4,5-dihydroxyphthalate decarboxylase